MNKITLSFAALAALMFVGLDAPAAEAGYGGFGLYVGGPNVRLDIGSSHGHYRSQSHQAYRRSYSNPRWYGSTNAAHYRGPANCDRRDASHYDYRSSRYYRHGNRYDYLPGRYDWHQGGHYGRHVGGHYGGHHGRHH